MPLQDSDNFIVGRGDESYKITYQDLKDDLNYVPPPTGTIDKPTVLAPSDGAGSGVTRDIVTDAITAVEGGGIDVCETSLIQSVDKTPPTTYDCRVLNGTFGDTPDSWDSLPPSPRYDGVAIGTKPTADTGIYMGLVYKIDVPGFIRINPNAGGADASIPVKLWSSNDGINWVGPTEVTQGNLDPSHASYDASIGFFGQYGCIQRQGGANIAAWYPTGSEALITLVFPDTQGFECFEVDDVVQDPDVKVISKNADANTITVDGGNWTDQDEFVAKYADNIDPDQFYNGAPERIYNGQTGSAQPETHCGFYANTETTVFNGPSVTVNTTLRVHANSDSSAVYKINGATVPVVGNNYAWGWRDVDFTGVMNTLTITDTFESSIAAIEVDGMQLYDQGQISNKLVKETAYDTKLTLAGAKDLDVLQVGDVVKMGMDADVPYQPVSDSIVTVTPDSPSAGQTTLTLSGDTDLAYFREGDVVQSEGYLGDWLAQFTAISGALTTPENAFNGIFVEDAAGTANYNAASVNSYGAIMIVDFTSGSKLPSGTVEILGGHPKNFQYLGGQTPYR